MLAMFTFLFAVHAWAGACDVILSPEAYRIAQRIYDLPEKVDLNVGMPGSPTKKMPSEWTAKRLARLHLDRGQVVYSSDLGLSLWKSEELAAWRTIQASWSFEQARDEVENILASFSHCPSGLDPLFCDELRHSHLVRSMDAIGKDPHSLNIIFRRNPHVLREGVVFGWRIPGDGGFAEIEDPVGLLQYLTRATLIKRLVYMDLQWTPQRLLDHANLQQILYLATVPQLLPLMPFFQARGFPNGYDRLRVGGHNFQIVPYARHHFSYGSVMNTFEVLLTPDQRHWVQGQLIVKVSDQFENEKFYRVFRRWLDAATAQFVEITTNPHFTADFDLYPDQEAAPNLLAIRINQATELQKALYFLLLLKTPMPAEWGS